MSRLKPTVAIDAAVFECMGALSVKAAAKVRKFIETFQADPSANGINYERIQNARDPRFRSVRIDQDLRGIVLAPEKGNLFVLLHVARHDDAYKWAQSQVARVNAATASLQVFSPSGQDAAGNQAKSASSPADGLFADLRDRHLTHLGVPDELMSAVRSVQNDADLEKLESVLPPEAYEALSFKAMGFTYEEVMAELDRKLVSKPVAADDFAAALQSSESKSRFFVAEDEEELQRMLDAPLEKWRVFLHPSQRNLVERDWNGPVRVLGGAGSGKTVAALHRARWLLANRFTKPSDKILFTTFSKNLALDLRENLRSICSEEQMSRMEVVNLDAWAFGLLKVLDPGLRMEYPGSKQLAQHWVQAAAEAKTQYSSAFLQDEWTAVVRPNLIYAREEYFQAARTGRGTPLVRSARSHVWDVFEAYKSRLKAARLIEASDAYRLIRESLASNSGLPRYSSVIVDESQDMDSEAFRLLQAVVAKGDGANSMFIVGDGHQRIYSRRAILGRCGITIRGRSRKLRINYRTSSEIMKWAQAMLDGVAIDDLDDGRDDSKGYRNLFRGPEPEIHLASSSEQEISHVISWIKRLTSREGLEYRNICVMARSHSSLFKHAGALREEKIPMLKLTGSKMDTRQRDGVRLSTMHRAKGLEFMAVALIGMNRGKVPSETALNEAHDEASKQEKMNAERMIVHVAATRAKKWLLVASSDSPSEFLAPSRKANA